MVRELVESLFGRRSRRAESIEDRCVADGGPAAVIAATSWRDRLREFLRGLNVTAGGRDHGRDFIAAP
jgi:hypothetical protein